MFRGRLRTKFLYSLLLTTAAVTCATLLTVQYRVRRQVREEILEGLHNSVVTFQSLERQREATLARSAALLASLPTLKAVMPTAHEATIQDASEGFWHLAGSDLFVLADRTGKVVALHSAGAGPTRSQVQELLNRSLRSGESRHWWFAGGHLTEVFLQPMYFGSAGESAPLGVLAIGYEVDDRLAQEVGRVASSQVAFCYGESIVVSTLSAAQQAALAKLGDSASTGRILGPQDIELGGERFLSTSVELAPGIAPPVSLTVLKSYDRATEYLENLNRMLVALGLAAVLVGSALVFLISGTFTRPLENLVAGVRALERGDYVYPLAPRGADEVSELTGAFDRMRASLQKSQQELLHAERLATIGRMASSISHDLRAPLTAFLAYSEFLSEGNLDDKQRQELYQEIRLAVNRMTGLIESLLEFSMGRSALRASLGDVAGALERALQTVQARPEFRRVAVTVTLDGPTTAWFDAAKLERAFQNLLLNAFEAVPPESAKIEVSIRRADGKLEIRIGDNGPGIAEPILESLFQPFVSHGKETGTGLGLAVVKKIVQDHGGEVVVERTGSAGTVFRVTLPIGSPARETANLAEKNLVGPGR